MTGGLARAAHRHRLLRLLHRAGEGARGLPAGLLEGVRDRLPAHHPPQGRAADGRALQRLGVPGRCRATCSACSRRPATSPTQQAGLRSTPGASSRRALDPLVTISPEGKITDVNEATVKVTGVPREELIGTDFSDYFTEPEKAREGYQQVFAKGFVTDYPLTIRHQDGRLTDVLYNASVYKDAAGQRARRVRRRARRDRAAAGRAVRPEPHRGEPRPAGHHQPRGQDHRRERGDRAR